MRIVPGMYRERADEDTITVTVVAELSGEDDEHLEELLREPGAWYDVTRRGISDTPVRMRFGRCVWQRTEEGAGVITWNSSATRAARNGTLCAGPRSPAAAGPGPGTGRGAHRRPVPAP